MTFAPPGRLRQRRCDKHRRTDAQEAPADDADLPVGLRSTAVREHHQLLVERMEQSPGGGRRHSHSCEQESRHGFAQRAAPARVPRTGHECRESLEQHGVPVPEQRRVAGVENDGHPRKEQHEYAEPARRRTPSKGSGCDVDDDAGLLAFAVGFAVGEPAIDDAIALEDMPEGVAVKGGSPVGRDAGERADKPAAGRGAARAARPRR